MKVRNILRSLAVASVLTFVLVGAVRNAAANASIARNATDLVTNQQLRIMQIMVTPQVAHNDIDLSKSGKAVDVTILGVTSFDFSEIDGQTVEFAKAIPAKSSTNSKDWNQDGVDDRTYTFTTSQLKLTPADTLACMALETVQKVTYRGCDKVKVLPAKTPN